MEARLRQVVTTILTIATAAAAFGCSFKTDVPIEFPTPPPAAVATPLPRLEIKRDPELEAAFAKIAEGAKGKVGAAAVVLETGEAALLNADGRYPMQSVYKLPISMAVMDQIRLGKLDLDEKIGVSKDDMVRAGQRSPLRDQSPNGGEFTIGELIRLAMVESDGTASDVLMSVAGGAAEIQSFVDQIGVTGMKVVNTEKEIGRDWQTQYDNWSTPMASVELLRYLAAVSSMGRAAETVPGEESPWDRLVRDMVNSGPGQFRLKGRLPAGTTVAHKTGTSGTQNGVTAATNDIGIILLPDRKRIAVAVFVSDSAADEKTREAIIAAIAKAAWDKSASK